MTPIDLRISELHATAQLDERVATLTLVGTADATVESALGTLLVHLHAELQRAAAQETRVDMYALEFMNSSCFKAFITWIVAAGKLAPERRYRIRFLCNPAIHWQKRSLRAMVHFGEDIVTVEAR